MLSEVWSFIEVDHAILCDTALKMAAEAQRTARIFKAGPCGVVFGSCSSEILEHLKWYGLKKVYAFRGETLSPEIIARSIHTAAVEYNPKFILFDSMPLGTEIAARLAASLERGLISGCVDFASEGGKPVARKVVYNGKFHATFTWMTPPPYLATVDTASLEDIREKTETQPEMIHGEIEDKPSLTKLVKKWKVSLSELDLGEARIVIGVGKGVETSFMEIINRLAAKLKGVIGGTRIAVYSGLIPPQRQIGTTGKWLNSDVYIAIGISGAPQHVMGIKETRNIIAINLLKQAPIFKYAKLGIVGDLYEVIPRLVEELDWER